MYQNDLHNELSFNQLSKVTTEDGLSDVLEHIKFSLDSQIPFDAINFIAIDSSSNEVFQVNYYTHKKHVCKHCSQECSFNNSVSKYEPYIFTNYENLAQKHPECYFFNVI